MTARALITGGQGFLGSHLAEFLIERGIPVTAVVRAGGAACSDGPTGGLGVETCDIRDGERLARIVAVSRPDLVFHLAAQSVPMLSWRDPETTFAVNVLGTLNVLEAVRNVEGAPTVVMCGSSAEYGFAREDELPIRETNELRPASPYGVSKAAAGMLAETYRRAYDMRVVRVRPFFVTGPRKKHDVCSDLTRGVVAAERAEQRSLKVGNLDAVRDFVDAADAVRALWILAEQGVSGEVYNLCTGEGRSVREALDLLVGMAKTPIVVERDPARLRPADEPVVVGDSSKLRMLGWQPRVPFRDTLANILAYWREEGRW